MQLLDLSRETEERRWLGWSQNDDSIFSDSQTVVQIEMMDAQEMEVVCNDDNERSGDQFVPQKYLICKKVLGTLKVLSFSRTKDIQCDGTVYFDSACGL